MNPESRIQNLQSEHGFTLVETMVAVFGFTIVMGGILALFSGIFTTSNRQTTLLSDTDQARKLAFQIAGELRDAQTGANGAYVLESVGDQQIVFYSNSDQDSVIERIRYFTQNGQLNKGVTEYIGNTYNVSNESVTVVQKDLANAANPVFYYYDDTYNGSTTQASLQPPISLAQVKFVKVSLQIYNKGGVKNTSTYTVTASAAIRNLKTNLGN